MSYDEESVYEFPGTARLCLVDQTTGEPCPTRGPVLCTVIYEDDSHRHLDSRLWDGFCTCDGSGSEVAGTCGRRDHRASRGAQ